VKLNLILVDSDVFYHEKQQYWHDGVAIKRDYMTLDDYDVKPGDTVYVQDKGTQVSYRLVKLLRLTYCSPRFSST